MDGRLPLEPTVHTSISTVDIENTLICVPGTEEFQQWLGGISFTGSGITCAQDLENPADIEPPTCPQGQVGTPPDCTVPPPPPTCPQGQVGTPPDCTVPPPPPTCPQGQVGTPPDCTVPLPLPPETCPQGQIGIPPDCSIPPSPELPEQPGSGDIDRVTGVKVTEAVEELSVSWDEFPGASGYRIQWKSEDSEEFDQGDTVTEQGETSYTIENLDPGTEYTVRIVAILDTGESLPAEANATPLGEEPPVEPPPAIPDTAQQGCGACAIGSDVPGEVSQSALLNMLVVMSMLLLASRKREPGPGRA